MTKFYSVINGAENESTYVEEQLAFVDEKKKPISQEEKYVRFNKIIKNEQGDIIAGGIAYSSLYYIGYIDTLWVDEAYRNQGFGARVLSALENELKNFGCENCHVDTFDFQAPEFYKKQGYQEFGKLSHNKAGVTEYFLAKQL